MTSTQVPPIDLAPGMPSRVVTISATDITEGGQSLAGQMLRFALSDSLDVSSGGDVIAKTQAEVVLDSNGEGSIRLPVYSEDVRTWCGDPDWAILVTATWGSQKAIRVPAGTTDIALSALPPVRPLRGREKQWAITGVAVNVSTGSIAAGSASLAGGVLNLDLTIPSGNWDRGILASGSDLAQVLPGVYRIPTYAAAGTVTPAIPSEYRAASSLTILGNETYRTAELAVVAGGIMPRPILRNELVEGSWTGWHRVDAASVQGWGKGRLAAATDLNTVTTPGTYFAATYADVQSLVNRPTQADATTSPAALEVLSGGTVAVIQRWTVASAPFQPRSSVERRRSANGEWSSWVEVGGGSSSDAAAVMQAVDQAYSKIGHVHDGVYVKPSELSSGISAANTLARSEAGQALDAARAYADSIVEEGTAVTPDAVVDAAVERAVIAGRIAPRASVPTVGAAPADRIAVRPVDHGAVGDGLTDDSAAISAAATEAVTRNVLLELGSGVYGVAARIDLPPGVNISASGAEFVSTQTIPGFMVTVADRSTVQGRLTLTVGGDLAAARGLQVNGSDVELGDIRVTSPEDDAGSGSTLTSGVEIQGDRVTVRRLTIRGFRYPCRIQESSNIQLGSVDIDGYIRGIYVRGSSGVQVLTARIARSFSQEVSPGFNAILLESTAASPLQDLLLENLECRDAAEHGIRFGGQYPIRRVTIRNARIAQVGAAGIKILGGQLSSGSIHEDIHLDGILVQDAGQLDTNSAAVLVHLARRVRIDGLTVVRLSKQYSASAGVEVQGADDVTVSSPTIRDTEFAAIHIRGNLGDSSRIAVTSGSLISDSGDGVRVDTASTKVAHLMLTGGTVVSTPSGVHLRHVSGSPVASRLEWVGDAGAPLGGDVSAYKVHMDAQWVPGSPVARKSSAWTDPDGTTRISDGAGWVTA